MTVAPDEAAETVAYALHLGYEYWGTELDDVGSPLAAITPEAKAFAAASSALDVLVARVAHAEQERDEWRRERLRLETRINQQRGRLAELDVIVADHAKHYGAHIAAIKAQRNRGTVAWREAVARAERAETALRRATYVAEHLLDMTDRDDFGDVIGPEGQHEGAYRQGSLAQEIREWKEIAAVLAGPPDTQAEEENRD